jgi:hypothetical protein
MRTLMVAGFCTGLMTGAAVSVAQETPEMPAPVKEHEWLQQLAGEWESETEITMATDQPPMKSKGTETARMVGGFWIVCKNKGTFMDKPFTGILTLGYDPQKEKYVGTWIDSVNSMLWQYEGTVDASGKALTLLTEGACGVPGKISKFRETLEIKSPDHKVFSSAKQGEDGEWDTFMTIQYRRTK